MFAKEGGTSSGMAMMFASMLKSLGLQPEIIERLSHGLLTDLKELPRVRGELVEMNARLEYLMRCTPSLEGDTTHADAWAAYCDERRAEIKALEDQANVRRNGGGSPPNSDREPARLTGTGGGG